VSAEEARARKAEWDRTLPRNPDWTPDYQNVWNAACAVCDRKFTVTDAWYPVGEGDDLVHHGCFPEYVEADRG
jgi:hypothetical protein